MPVIRRFAFAVLVSLLCMGAAAANPFRVGGVAVDVSAGTPNEAVSRGRAQARLEAAQRLIERLTLAEDRQAAGGVDVNEIARLYTSVDIEGTEKRTATRYIAVLAVNFDADAVRSYLDARRIPFVESQAAKALISPVAATPADAERFRGAFQPLADASVLAPYQVGVPAVSVSPSALAAEANAASARRVIVAELAGRSGAWTVALSELASDGSRNALGSLGPFGDERQASGGVIRHLETLWKAASVVRTSGSAQMSAVARFSALEDWVRIRRALETSRLVSQLKVEALSMTGADLSFVYAGRPEQLAADLSARGASLTPDGRVWVIRRSGGG